MSARWVAAILIAGLVGAFNPAAHAQTSGACHHGVVIALPGVTWQELSSSRPPNILRAARDGAVGTMSVRTIRSVTTPADAFTSISAGARAQGGNSLSASVPETSHGVSKGLWQRDVHMQSIHTIDSLADQAGYDASPGALAGALGSPLIAIGNSDHELPTPNDAGIKRWSLLASMDERGRVPLSATGPDLLTKDPSAPFGVRTDPSAIEKAIDKALQTPCSSLIVDPGDLDRADVLATASHPIASQRRDALMAADAIVGHVSRRLGGHDLMLLVTTTSPTWADSPHLGVAIADGASFQPGTSLVSASTRRAPNVTLPDVAPTLLALQGKVPSGTMDGRPMTSVRAVAADRMSAAISLDRESVYVDSLKGRVDAGYITFQILVYLVASVLLIAGARRGEAYLQGRTGSVLAVISLALAAFPAAVYLAGIVEAYRVGVVVYSLLFVAVDAALVGLACLVVRPWLDRLLVLALFTVGLVFVNLAIGAPLELNTVFGYSPIVAGRFAGLGNTGFAVLGGAVVIAASLIAQRSPAGRRSMLVIVMLFALAVIFDGAPQLGSDVGGIIAFVPALGVTAFLLMDVRPRPAIVLAVLVAAVVVVGLFLAIDLSRPVEDQTHLARLFEAVRSRGLGELTDTIRRKASANLKIFRTTFFTYLFPPALAAMAFLLLRPRGRWRRLAREYPKIRAGLIGGIVLGALGAAVNDSGIVIPAMMLSFFVPLALLVHLELERSDRESAAGAAR